MRTLSCCDSIPGQTGIRSSRALAISRILIRKLTPQPHALPCHDCNASRRQLLVLLLPILLLLTLLLLLLLLLQISPLPPLQRLSSPSVTQHRIITLSILSPRQRPRRGRIFPFSMHPLPTHNSASIFFQSSTNSSSGQKKKNHLESLSKKLHILRPHEPSLPAPPPHTPYTHMPTHPLHTPHTPPTPHTHTSHTHPIHTPHAHIPPPTHLPHTHHTPYMHTTRARMAAERLT